MVVAGAEFRSRPLAIGDWEMLRATETQVKVALLASGFCDQKKKKIFRHYIPG